MNAQSDICPCLFLHTRRLDRRLSRIFDARLRGIGLRGTQYGLLRAIEGLERPTVSEIGRLLCMDQSTVTRNVEKLAKAGLAEVAPDAADPRKRRVAITGPGRAKLEAGRAPWEETQALIRERLGEEDYLTLLALLAKAAAL